MKRKLFNISCVSLVVLSLIMASTFTFNTSAATAKSSEYIDNSDVMPKYVTDEYVTLEDSVGDGELMSPDWIKSAIMAEIRIETCTDEGTLEAAVKALDHYQEMGVNLLWVSCMMDKGCYTDADGVVYPGTDNNSYCNRGPETLDPNITGTTDNEEGFRRLAWFVREAHKRNIRIICDVITWGASADSELYREHPEYFKEWSKWGGPSFDVFGEPFCSWYKQCMVDMAMKTGIDGFRVDCEPEISGYDLWRSIREELYARGRKVAIISEVPNDRNGTYDFAISGVADYTNGWHVNLQVTSINPHDYYLDYYDIIDSIKTGECIGTELSQLLGESGHFRYYTYNLSEHDYALYTFRKNLLRTGYQAFLAPFIPVFMMGDEIGTQVYNATLYFASSLDLSLLDNPENREFYETLKKYIRIRRSYPSLFNLDAVDHTETKICRVNVSGQDNLTSYARYDGKGNAVIVVPNSNIQNKDGKMTVSLSFGDMQMYNYKSYTVTDLMTDKEIVSGSKKDVGSFDIQVDPQEIGVYLIKGIGKTSDSPDGVNTKTVIEPGNTITQIEEVDDIVENVDPDKVTNNVTKTRNVIRDGGFPSTFWWVLGVSAALIVAAGTVLILLIVSDRKRNAGRRK